MMSEQGNASCRDINSGASREATRVCNVKKKKKCRATTLTKALVGRQPNFVAYMSCVFMLQVQPTSRRKKRATQFMKKLQVCTCFSHAWHGNRTRGKQSQICG